MEPASYGFASDDTFARYRTRADFHPDLPVGVRILKGEMLALDAMADMLGIDDVRHQDIISVGEQKICTRQLNGQLVPQAVDQLIDRAARSASPRKALCNRSCRST